MLQAIAAGVMQLLSLLMIVAAIVVCGTHASRAQEACAGAPNEQVEAAEGDGWLCGEVEPSLDLTLPDAAALPKPVRKDEPFKVPADARASAPLPIAVTPSDTGAGARASLQTLRDYNAQIAAQKAEALKSSSFVAPEALPVPKGPAGSRPALDIWSSFDAQGFDAEAGRAVKSGAGLDYRVVKNASVGVAAERTEQSAASAGAGGSSDEKVSAYMAFRAMPSVTVDARTQWQRFEMPAAGADASASIGEKSSLVVAPRVGKAFALGEGHTLEPYLEVKREINLGAGGAAAGLAASDSAGAGVNLSKAGGYAVSVTADVSAAAGNEAASVNSKLQFKLPLD